MIPIIAPDRVPRPDAAAVRPRIPGFLLCLLLSVVPAAVGAQEPEDDAPSPPGIVEKTRGMQHMEGFFDLYWDPSEGHLYLQVDRWREEVLYQVSLATGLGSNPVGLDRGQLGATRIVEFRRVGPRVLLVATNHGYRARTEDADEARAVREAFAPSTLWGFEVAAETGDRVLVDATDFFLRDAHGVVRRLEETDQGTFQRDAERSVIHLPRTRSFPRNTEVEASLTFTSEDPGPLVRRTAADGRAVTLRQHHSLVELPAPGYEPRPGDHRVGAFGITFRDYARPIDRDTRVWWAARHRLRKRTPGAGPSPAREPLVYHVDPGIPEPVRSAVIEGASWWEEAFRAAGFEDAFRVEVLPEGADPMDVRYNVIHWTHRRTRGWSYGASVTDPRTGEILKANVNLGSLRLRQDFLLGQGLVAPYAASADETGGAPRRHGAPGASAGPRPAAASGHPLGGGGCDLAAGPGFGYLASVAPATDPAEMALARVRQLSAHEVGHTLGLAHNFAASTYDGRASVMDYPAPRVRLGEDGTLDLSDAYDVGVGSYDEFAVRWLYSEFGDDVDESAALDSIVREGLAEGHLLLSDADARPPGAAHPRAGLWDDGSDPVEALRHAMEVRRRALRDFGLGAIREGEPVAALEEVLVPLYLHHRYQVEATAHTLGGVEYRHALRGDGQTPVRRVPGDRQQAALEALLATLEPGELVLPDRVLELLPPRAFGMGEGEAFPGHTGPLFDPVGVARAAADLTLRFLLQPERMARLVDAPVPGRSPDGRGAAGGRAAPTLREVVDRTLEATWLAEDPASPRPAAVARAVERSVLDRLLSQVESPDNPPRVRAELGAGLRRLASHLERLEEPGPHAVAAREEIRRWRNRRHGATPSAPPLELPPGSPIGEPGGG